MTDKAVGAAGERGGMTTSNLALQNRPNYERAHPGRGRVAVGEGPGEEGVPDEVSGPRSGAPGAARGPRVNG